MRNITFLFKNIKFKRKVLSTSGQSLAEFAVITAMMATFITTAMPKFSDVMESGKRQKSIDELDKLLLSAKNFYETTSAQEGRGRLPGQDKFDMQVGGYSDTTELYYDLENFTSFTDTIGTKWISVFGTQHPEALAPIGSYFQNDTVSADVDANGNIVCRNCSPWRLAGSDEWFELFNKEVFSSGYQDGHYIYIVIPGSGSGENARAPRIAVADAENPNSLHKIMEL